MKRSHSNIATPRRALSTTARLHPIASQSRSRNARSTDSKTRTRTCTTRDDDAFVVALIDNSVKDVGFCAYNLNSFDVELRQFADSNTFAAAVTALCVFNPVEILLSVSTAGGLLDQAIQMSPYLGHVKRTFIGRSYFNETYGALVVEKLSNTRCPSLAKLGESACYLALASCGALIRYIEHVEELSFSPSSLRITFRPNDGVVFLDMNTLEALEIVSNAQAHLDDKGPQTKACLLRVMDKTKTRAGKRFLRRALLEPSADINNITMRQNAVKELSLSEELYFALIAAILRFPDLERSLAALMAKEHVRLRQSSLNERRQQAEVEVENDSDNSDETQPLDFRTSIRNKVDASPPSLALIRDVLNIKAALGTVPALLQAVERAKSPLLKAIAESMRNPGLSDMEAKINEVIDPEAIPAKEIGRMRMQGAFAIKKGTNGKVIHTYRSFEARLDLVRDMLTENIQDIQGLAEETRIKYAFHKLQLSLDAKAGYHFSINSKFIRANDFPDEFIAVNHGTKMYRFSTEKLRQLNCRYHDNLRKIWQMTEIELGSLLNEIFKPERIAVLHRLCDSTAILDCLTSFVTYSSLCHVATEKPTLTKDGPIALRQAYHPTLLDLNPRTAVPNDVFLDESCALHLISGRNQAGKSTFIKMVAIICVMAHTGCTIPAKFASVRVLQKISSRFGTGDDISQFQSHFSREMKDVASIMDGLKKRTEIGNRRVSRCGEINKKDGNNNTLVLIDELGRSTSTLDGFAIAYGVIEHLASVPNVLTLFTTHFLGLGALSKVNPTIKAFHMSTINRRQNRIREEEENIPNLFSIFTYTVQQGMLTDCSYGIETARLAGFPKDVIQDAIKLRKDIPVRKIALPDEFEKAHLQLDEGEARNCKKLGSVVSIARRISTIKSSTEGNLSERRRMLRELQEKVKGNTRNTTSNHSGVTTLNESTRKTEHADQC